MRGTPLGFAAAIVAAALLSGCADGDGEQAVVGGVPANDTVATTVTSPAGPDPADAQAPTVNAADSRFLTEALQQGMGQIELAQSVSRRSESKAVDELAREVIATNNQLNADLARIAAAHSVPLPADAAPRLRQLIARLEPMNGQNLDAAYLAAMLQVYPELVAVHAQAATNAINMDLKSVAVRARDLLNDHMRLVRAAYAEVTGVVPPVPVEGGSPPPASATPEGRGR